MKIGKTVDADITSFGHAKMCRVLFSEYVVCGCCELRNPEPNKVAVNFSCIFFFKFQTEISNH